MIEEECFQFFNELFLMNFFLYLVLYLVSSTFNVFLKSENTVKEGMTPPPIGLVSSEWGGSPIEAWSPPGVLDKCGDHLDHNSEKPHHNEHSLWNGMVNPLKWNTMKGFIWYQGERNSNHKYHRDKYQCTFPAMIAAWRQEFSQHSSTSSTAPFGFVQLGK